jgi:hypothetical protein
MIDDSSHSEPGDSALGRCGRNDPGYEGGERPAVPQHPALQALAGALAILISAVIVGLAIVGGVQVARWLM